MNRYKQYIKDNFMLITALLLSIITIIYLIGVGIDCTNSCNQYWADQVVPIMEHCPYYQQEFNNYTDGVNYLYIIGEEDGD